MPTLTNLATCDLLDAFAAATPNPGGGSAVALAGATGVSLMLMAIGIRLSKPKDSTPTAVLTDAAEHLRSVRSTMTALIDRDADAYSSVVAALRMPGDPGATAEDRRVVLQSALRNATDVPMETMRACRLALREAPAVAASCTKSARSDVGVAIELLHAAVRGAGLTVEANLGSLEDTEYADRVRGERQRLESESAADAEHGLSHLSRRST